MSGSRKSLPSRHETFCQHVADGCTATEAARYAGFPPVDAAHRGMALYARPEIQNRIGELEAERAAERKAVRARTLSRLDTIHDKAAETGNISLAFRATMAIARLSGMNDMGARQPRSEPMARTAQEDAASKPALQVPPHLQATFDKVMGIPPHQPPGAGALALGGAAHLPASVLDAMRHPAPAPLRP